MQLGNYLFYFLVPIVFLSLPLLSCSLFTFYQILDHILLYFISFIFLFHFFSFIFARFSLDRWIFFTSHVIVQFSFTMSISQISSFFLFIIILYYFFLIFLEWMSLILFFQLPITQCHLKSLVLFFLSHFRLIIIFFFLIISFPCFLDSSLWCMSVIISDVLVTYFIF